jgi:hypothetical protein
VDVRAGLLSQPEVIQAINARFVSTTLTYSELTGFAKSGDELAGIVSANWSSPVSLMFLTPEGRFVSKLSPLKDLTDVHPDTSPRPGQNKSPSAEQNTRIFLSHLAQQFGASP